VDDIVGAQAVDEADGPLLIRHGVPARLAGSLVLPQRNSSATVNGTETSFLTKDGTSGLPLCTNSPLRAALSAFSSALSRSSSVQPG